MKEQLLQEARMVMEKAYVPFSNFKVGAVIKTESGKLYHGCNIENSSYSLTCCAERVAIFNAISDGERSFTYMAITAKTATPIQPCGACRQVMAQFFKRDMPIFLGCEGKDVIQTSIHELLPFPFDLEVNS